MTTMDKAYKLLSIQKHISHNKAKSLIDNGLVSANGKKLTLARTLVDSKTSFRIQEIDPISTIATYGDLLVVNKPSFLESYAVQARFNGYELLHRLDKETSGVLLLAKANSPKTIEIIQAFKARKVEKIYYALVNGILAESKTIDAPILTKKGKSAKSKVHKDGLPATTHITPESIVGKKTLLKVQIETGRTHQIRAHLAHIGYPIIGDILYGGTNASRLMLHASHISLLGLQFEAPLPKAFTLC